MKNIHFLIVALLLSISNLSNAQQQNKNSDTRNFIDSADFTQVNKDWNIKAEFKSGLGEVVSFFPVEAIDLKTNSKIRSLQMDMTITNLNSTYFKSSWIDLNEVEEFVNFIEQYVIPNLNDKTESKQSTTYIFNSKEIRFSFLLGKNYKRVSIYLKDLGITDYHHYFWTETQVSKIPDLLNMLKQLK